MKKHGIFVTLVERRPNFIFIDFPLYTQKVLLLLLLFTVNEDLIDYLEQNR